MRTVNCAAIILLLVLLSACSGDNPPSTATTSNNAAATITALTESLATALAANAPLPTATAEATAGTIQLTAQPASSPGAAVSAAVAGPFTITVNSVNEGDNMGAGAQAAQGYTFLVVNLTVANTGSDAADFNIFDFSAQDSGGFVYSLYAFAPNPQLNGSLLQPGAKARGNLAFQVQATAKGFVLIFSDFSLTGDTYNAALPLTQ